MTVRKHLTGLCGAAEHAARRLKGFVGRNAKLLRLALILTMLLLLAAAEIAVLANLLSGGSVIPAPEHIVPIDPESLKP